LPRNHSKIFKKLFFKYFRVISWQKNYFIFRNFRIFRKILIRAIDWYANYDISRRAMPRNSYNQWFYYIIRLSGFPNIRLVAIIGFSKHSVFTDNRYHEYSVFIYNRYHEYSVGTDYRYNEYLVFTDKRKFYFFLKTQLILNINLRIFGENTNIRLSRTFGSSHLSLTSQSTEYSV
jgi:hypothetical protein